MGKNIGRSPEEGARPEAKGANGHLQIMGLTSGMETATQNNGLHLVKSGAKVETSDDISASEKTTAFSPQIQILQ